MIFSLSGCASIFDTFNGIAVYRHLYQGHILLKEGDFEVLRRESQDILDHSSTRSPADAALFNLGLIFAHQGNPNQDYERSSSYFSRLVEEFPASPLSEEAKIWVSIIDQVNSVKQKQNEQIQKKRNITGMPQSYSMDKLAVKDDFEDALKENQKILTQSAGKPPGDVALFNMGLIYAHYENPKKDFKKSVVFLKRLVDEYPQSPYAEEAKVWLGVFQVIERIQQVDIEIEEKKKEFSQ